MRRPPPTLKALPGGAERSGVAPTAIRLLLVEDSPEQTLLVREGLANVWYVVPIEVQSVERLGSALERVAAGRVDVVLLDLSLPDAQGLDMIARFRAVQPSLPIVIMTGRDDDAVAVEALRRGAQDYLVKGDQDPAALARAIRNAVERKRAEESLRTSEETFRTLIEYSPDSVFVHRGGRIVYVNQAVLAFLKYDSAESLLGRLLVDFIHPEDRREASLRIREVTEEWRRVAAKEFRLMRRDGAVVTAEVIAQPGAFRGEPAVVAFARDVTGRNARNALADTLDDEEDLDAGADSDSDSDSDSAPGDADADAHAAGAHAAIPLAADDLQVVESEDVRGIRRGGGAANSD
jgi:PAS domain S-box-containing protein